MLPLATRIRYHGFLMACVLLRLLRHIAVGSFGSVDTCSMALGQRLGKALRHHACARLHRRGHRCFRPRIAACSAIPDPRGARGPFYSYTSVWPELQCATATASVLRSVVSGVWVPRRACGELSNPDMRGCSVVLCDDVWLWHRLVLCKFLSGVSDLVLVVAQEKGGKCSCRHFQ